MQLYFWTIIFPAVRIAFVGIALLSFFYYGVQLLLARHEDSAQTEAKNAYEMAITGCAVIMMVTILVDTFSPVTGVNPAPLGGALLNIIAYFKYILATVVTLRIVVQGVRLIALQGQGEGELEKQKKQFFNGLIGIAVILLANALVASFFPGAGTAVIAAETVGIANFLLTIGGALSLVTIIAAGGMLILSVDETWKDRAKKTISGTVIALVVMLSAYVLVTYFLAL